MAEHTSTSTRSRCCPLYRQIADRLIDAIRIGTLSVGDRLPSVRQTATNEGASLVTAVRAYEVLVAEGWAEADPRRGYFVTERAALQECCDPLAPHVQEVRISDRLLKLLHAMQSPGMVPLGSALPAEDLYPDAALRRALSSAAYESGSLVHYPNDPWGCLALREAIATRLALRGCLVSPDEIIITNGCLEAVSIALRSVTKPGDAVIVSTPTYYGLLQMLEGLGLNAIETRTDTRTGADVDAIEAALYGHPSVSACLLVTNFSNPLGSSMPDAEKERLVALLADRNVTLVEDDIYGELAYDGVLPIPAKNYDDDGSVLLCGSFTKSLAPGARVGWLVAGRHVEEALRHKFETNVATNITMQEAIARLIENGTYDRVLRKLRTTVRDRIGRTTTAIRRSFPEGTRVSDPQGGFVVWVRLPGGSNGDRLANLALARGISVFPGSAFSVSGLFHDCVRLNGSLLLDERVLNAIQILGRLAEECR